MKFSVKFKEQQSKINVNFSDTQYASDGGFERGYEQGYEQGAKDGEKQAESIVAKTITEYSNNSIKRIGDYVFCKCNKLKFVNCPEVEEVNEYAFKDCDMLEKAIIPKLTNISQGIFQNCHALLSVDLPNATGRINGYAFRDCTNLVNVNLPKVTNLGNWAFGNCSSLEKLDFWAVTRIENVFQGCTNLKIFILRVNQVCALGSSDSFLNTPIKSGTGYIYVPDDLVEQYKTATNWSVYASQIKPLSALEE